MFRVAHFLVLFVGISTCVPIFLHYRTFGVISWYQAALAFFLPLNALISVWEIALGIHINLIKSDYQKLQEKHGKNRMGAVVDFFVRPLSISDIFSLKVWSRVWSTYSLYDPSYSNQESFGFFVDVGNGWTTLIPSLVYLYGMTFPILPYQVLGAIGLVKFYQEFYGTVIYFLSFFFNKRYQGKSTMEVALFVGVSNGLWFIFPLIGMYCSWMMIQSNTNQIFTHV